MPVRHCIVIFFLIKICYPSINAGFYADITDELLILPASASLAGSDLSTGSGVSVESTPGNLPFDSLNRLSLSYAGFYNNTFSTSIITYNGKPRKDLGVSILAGYLYVPEILKTDESASNDSGELTTVKTSYFSASRMIFRVGAGRLFKVTPLISLGAGLALNAKRIRLPETGYGMGIDAGVKVYFENPGLSFAIQMENITSSYTYWNEYYQERAYHHLRAGAGFERYLPSFYGTIRISYATPDLFANEGINSINYDKTENDNPIETLNQYELYDRPTLLFSQGRYGIEYTVMNAVSFRGGLTNNHFSFGAGLRLLQNRTGIDLAYLSHELSGTYQLSIDYRW